MNAIQDRIGLRKFLTRIFISNSGVSSRRVGGFICLFALLFLVFFQYPIEYCKIIGILTIGFFGLTTVTSLFAKTPNGDEDENSVNTNNKG